MMNWLEEFTNPLLYGYARCIEDASNLSKDKYGSPMNRDSSGTWRYSDGSPAPPDVVERLKSLRPIPPAYKDVRLSNDGANKAVSTNPNNPKKPQVDHYSPEHTEQAKREKHDRVAAYHADKPGIDAKIAADLKSDHMSTRESAAVLHLINKTSFRLGSDAETGSKQQAFGASTLRADHVSIDGSKVNFNFVGKKGVKQNKTVSDASLAKMLKPRVDAASKTGGKLFNTSDDKVRSHFDKITDGKYTPKDMRTWSATSLAKSEVDKLPKPQNEKEFKAAQKNVAETVASHLGNTPAVALSSYIDPRVWDKWK